MNHLPSTYAYILAGGRSLRMGREKGLLNIQGKPMIERVAKAIKDAGIQYSVISNQDHYAYLGVPVIKDIIPGKGPLGGIYTGMVSTPAEYVLFISCDMPFLITELILHLKNNLLDGHDVVVPAHNGNIEPLCAFYHSKLTNTVLKKLNSNDLGVHSLIRSVHTRLLEVGSENYYSNQLFYNINTPAELELADEIWK